MTTDCGCVNTGVCSLMSMNSYVTACSTDRPPPSRANTINSPDVILLCDVDIELLIAMSPDMRFTWRKSGSS